MTTQSDLALYSLPPEEEPAPTVCVRCCCCGREEIRPLGQAGLRCTAPGCGACVSIVSESALRREKGDATKVLRYWKQGQLDPATIQIDDDPAGVAPLRRTYNDCR